ncbi:MAG: hypothetical protein JXM69_06615 [Anaerolineae bacterium]|nr:hypothetical protein [Anaerolineae bacterium]
MKDFTQSGKILLPLLLAGLALAAALLLPVGAGASDMGPKTALPAADVPAGAPPELGALSMGGPTLKLSGSEGYIPEVAANNTFVAVAYVQGYGNDNKRVRLLASQGLTGWGFTVGVDSANLQGNNARLAFNPMTTNTVHVVWSSNTGQYIRHARCTLAETTPACAEYNTIADGGGTDRLLQPDIAADAMGSLHVAWYDKYHNRIMLAYSEPNAHLTASPKWTTTTAVDLTPEDFIDVRQPALAVAGDYVHLAVTGEETDPTNNWVTRYYRFDRSDHSIAGPWAEWSSQADDVITHTIMNNPAIAASGPNVFLTWDNRNNTAYYDDYYALVGAKNPDSGDYPDWSQLRHITSTHVATDGLQTEDMKLSGGEGEFDAEQFLRPSLAVTGSNEFAVVWQQRPQTECSENGTSEIYYASRTNGDWDTNEWTEKQDTVDFDLAYYSVDPDIVVNNIGRHIVFMMGPDNGGCSGPANPSDYAIYYHGPITKTLVSGGVYLPIIVKNKSG